MHAGISCRVGLRPCMQLRLELGSAQVAKFWCAAACPPAAAANLWAVWGNECGPPPSQFARQRSSHHNPAQQISTTVVLSQHSAGTALPLEKVRLKVMPAHPPQALPSEQGPYALVPKKQAPACTVSVRTSQASSYPTTKSQACAADSPHADPAHAAVQGKGHRP